MTTDFAHTTLGRTGLRVHRLGLSASYRPGSHALEHAIDIFLFLGVMKEKQFPLRARDELYRLREEGKVRFVGMSCHDRKFAGRMAEEGGDVLPLRPLQPVCALYVDCAGECEGTGPKP